MVESNILKEESIVSGREEIWANQAGRQKGEIYINDDNPI